MEFICCFLVEVPPDITSVFILGANFSISLFQFRDNELGHTTIIGSLFCFVFSQDRVSHSPGWSQTHYVTKVNS